jgi:hypothetical protein
MAKVVTLPMVTIATILDVAAAGPDATQMNGRRESPISHRPEPELSPAIVATLKAKAGRNFLEGPEGPSYQIALLRGKWIELDSWCLMMAARANPKTTTANILRMASATIRSTPDN